MKNNSIALPSVRRVLILIFLKSFLLVAFYSQAEKNKIPPMVKKEGFSNLGVLEEINFAPPSKSSSKTTSLPQSQSSTAPVRAKAIPPSKPKIAQVTPRASTVTPQASPNSVS